MEGKKAGWGRGKSYIDLLLQWQPSPTQRELWSLNDPLTVCPCLAKLYSDMTHHGNGCDVELNSSLQLRHTLKVLNACKLVTDNIPGNWGKKLQGNPDST